jgi:DNA polymerase III gamma/tau subunit
VKVALKPISHKDLTKLVSDIAQKEGVELENRLIDKIAETANGSARNAVKELEKVIRITDPKERMAAVGGSSTEVAAFDLVKAMLPFNGSKPNWKQVAAVLEAIKEEDPEGIRMMLLATATTMMLKGDERGYKVACCFDKPFFDKVSGRAMLMVGCWEIVHKA